MKRLFLFLLVLPCLILHGLGQNAHSSESENLFSKTFSKEKYLADFDELTKTLVQTHPTPYKFTSQDAFEAILNKNKRAISDETTYSEFIWRCSEIVASLNCSHTSLGYFNQEDKILPIHLRFPLEAHLIEDRLYISDPLINENKVDTEVGRYTYVSAATSFPEDRGILPDHFIIQPIQDFIKNRDTVMEYTLGLIEGKE